MTLTAPQTAPRVAGAFYLAIIIIGLTAELALRTQFLRLDAEATAQLVQSTGLALPLAIVCDTLMLAADVVVAVLLYQLLKPAGPTLALAAMIFRLMQAATIGAKIMFDLSALLTYRAGGDIVSAQNDLLLAATGYDLGLIFFGVNSLLTALLVIRFAGLPSLLGYGLAAAGLVYLTGSYLRILAPTAYDTFAPAYAITILTELAFALWLLLRGVRTPD